MANNDNLPQIQACATRLAVLNSAGIPLPGANNLYVTSALIELQVNPVYEDGDEITVKNACGTICNNYKNPDNFKRADISITICTWEPYLTAILGGGDVLTDGGVNGFAFPPIGLVTGDGVSIEVWAKRIDDGDLHDEFPYAWCVLPKVKNLRIGNQTFGNSERNPVFTGQALENPNWYDGPANDWPAASDRVFQWFPAAALPTITDAPEALAAS